MRRAVVLTAFGRVLCRLGWHSWSQPVPLAGVARHSRRVGKAKWTRVCLRVRADGRFCGAILPGYLRRVA